MKRYILLFIGIVLWSLSMSSESTTDISYILPDGGYFGAETGR